MEADDAGWELPGQAGVFGGIRRTGAAQSDTQRSSHTEQRAQFHRQIAVALGRTS